MFSEGIFPIGDGLLDVDEQLLKGLLVPHDINDIYDVEQTPFARGKFAAVRRAIHKNSGVHFAAKFLKRRRRAQSSDKEIKHEIAVLMLCDGAENIVKLNAVHESRSDTALLLELATGGELQTFLDNEECLSEAQARFCMREVLKGLQFLHKRSIAHLDLKPQNILLTGENIEDGLKLCDFGISRVVEEGSNVREIVGTPDYVAPEVLQYEPLSLLTDIWSVGVLTYVLLTGFSPFGGDTKQETFLNISQCALEFPDKLFDGVSSAAIDFMRRALRIKPSDRMSAAGCLEHIWLKDECDIGRQIYENISKVATNGDVEPSCSSNSDLDEDDDVDVDVDAEQQSDSQSDKMESSDVEVAQTTKITTNGSLKKKTQTTTAVHTVPATRATTIPLCTHIHQKHYQQQQQRQRGQQQQHMSSLLAGRRHSSDSNKENTFLATKKIQPITNVANVTTTATTNNKSTATIIIGAINTKANMVDGKNGTNISQMHNNNDDKQIIIENHIKCNNVNNCLFPDAPTTPKVIRKAPNSDDSSPTSVKALVKKFQLEPTTNGTAITMPTVPVSATSTTTTTTTINGTTTTTNRTTNGKCSTLILKQQKSPPQQQQQPVVATTKSRKNSISPQKTVASPTKSTTMKTHVVNDQQNHRRSSEPQVTSATAKSPTRTTTTTITSPNSYKSTCVYCLTCGATSNSNSSNGVGVGVGENGNNSTTNGCRHSSVRSTPSPTSSGSKTSLIPLYHHRHHQHHHQHHHHHELVVAKNGASAGAASNLSLDQGIIC